MRNNKGLGGPLDLIHSFFVFGIAVALLRVGFHDSELTPLIMMAFGVILIISEILGILM